MMPSPTTMKGLLGQFLSDADLIATNQRASPPPVRFPEYFYLRAILAVGDGGEGAHGAERANAGSQETAGVGVADQG